jgi:hypothetical protein
MLVAPASKLFSTNSLTAVWRSITTWPDVIWWTDEVSIARIVVEVIASRGVTSRVTTNVLLLVVTVAVYLLRLGVHAFRSINIGIEALAMELSTSGQTRLSIPVMNGSLTHSNLSFLSFESSQRARSIISFTTSTDTVHAQGIGTLSGRIIYAFGEVALRGIESLAIRRRLRTVISAFPHQDDILRSDIETIYDHALELSRYSSLVSTWFVLKCN